MEHLIAEKQKGTASKLTKGKGPQKTLKAPSSAQPKKPVSPPSTPPEEDDLGQSERRPASEEARTHRAIPDFQGHGQSRSTSIPTQTGPEPPVPSGRKYAGSSRVMQRGEQQLPEAWKQQGGINLDEGDTVRIQPSPRKKGRMELPGTCKRGGGGLEVDQT
jgi:hypothetical protein